MPPARSPLADLFAALEIAFRQLGVRWYLFGAQAALLHGAARLTADVDVTVEVGGISTGDLLRALEGVGFTARVADAETFADRTRALLLTHSATSIPVDVILAGVGLEELFLDRAEIRIVEGISIPVASAEDILTMKILAGRAKDVEDATAILSAAGAGLDLKGVRDILAKLEEALSQSDLIPRLDEIVASARRRES